MIVVGWRLPLRAISAQLVDRSSISATAISSREFPGYPVERVFEALRTFFETTL